MCCSQPPTGCHRAARCPRAGAVLHQTQQKQQWCSTRHHRGTAIALFHCASPLGLQGKLPTWNPLASALNLWLGDLPPAAHLPIINSYWNLPHTWGLWGLSSGAHSTPKGELSKIKALPREGHCEGHLRSPKSPSHGPALVHGSWGSAPAPLLVPSCPRWRDAWLMGWTTLLWPGGFHCSILCISDSKHGRAFSDTNSPRGPAHDFQLCDGANCTSTVLPSPNTK